MRFNSLRSKSEVLINHSINTYSKLLMKDIHLTLRLTYNNLTYPTKPVEWVENTITFEAPMQGIDYVIIPKDTLLSAALVSKVAIFHTTFRVLKSFREDANLYYIAEITSPIIKKQQRESFRLEVILDTHYELIFSDTASNTNTNTNTNIIQGNGTCLNISVGGMCLSCNHQFHAKDFIKVDFTLIETPLSLTAEVLYLGERTENGSYLHRIHFTDINAPKRNLLRHLIFEKQRLQLRYHSE